MPNAAITPAEIGRFEAMSVTNEWDSQSICAALMLIDLWKVDGTVRYEGVAPRASIVTENAPDISAFLDRFTEIGDDPGPRAYQILTDENPWLNADQREAARALMGARFHDALDRHREKLSSLGFTTVVLADGMVRLKAGGQLPTSERMAGLLEVLGRIAAETEAACIEHVLTGLAQMFKRWQGDMFN